MKGADDVTVDVGGRRLSLSSLQRVLYPETGFTKGALIDYYARVADVMLPHIAQFPMTLKRYPAGVQDKFFFQKTCRGHPEWMPTKTVPSVLIDQKYLDYCLINEVAALVWAANLSTIELHPLLARAEDITIPTVVAFDLDPGQPAGILAACSVALLLRDLLADIGLSCLPKTSGGKGLHIYVPLNTPHTYDRTKAFARTVAAALTGGYPDTVVDRMDKRLRAGKVFIDWSQNDPTKTTVAAYSVRARQRPTVSTPVQWSEIEQACATGDAGLLEFDTLSVPDRITKFGDLFADVLRLEQTVPVPDRRG